jgi:hypothetical protein
MIAYNSNNAVIRWGCNCSIVWTHSQVSNVTLSNIVYNIIQSNGQQILKQCKFIWTGQNMLKYKSKHSHHVHGNWPNYMQFPLTKFLQVDHLNQ